MRRTASFSGILLHWYSLHGRNLPWRHTQDPYPIWLSEIILQQTRVDQGMPYYYRFLEEYPSIFDLAGATEEHVLKSWQGLGYYSRARNLHKTARYLVDKYNGQFPETYHGLLSLPGIGPYTAAAIASFAFGERVPVVDGNVFRFLARYLGISTDIGGSKARQEFTLAAAELMEEASPGLFNQALMEFGALHCVPGQPNCPTCPFNDLCQARNSGKVMELPVKSKKQKVQQVHFNFMDIRKQTSTFLMKRSGDGIWKNLYQFPLIESGLALQPDELITEAAAFLDIPAREIILLEQKAKTHLLSHKKILAVFWKIQVPDSLILRKNDIFELKQSEVMTYPIPRLMELYLEETYVSK